MKNKTIIVRVEPKVKKALKRMAASDRRELSDWLRILFEDLIKAKSMKHLLIIIACSLVWGCTEVSQLDSNAQVAISIVGPIAAVAGLLGFFYFVYKYDRE